MAPGPQCAVGVLAPRGPGDKYAPHAIHPPGAVQSLPTPALQQALPENAAQRPLNPALGGMRLRHQLAPQPTMRVHFRQRRRQ